MKPSMLILGSILFGAPVLRPQLASAQAMNRADLVGTWDAIAGEDPRIGRKNDTLTPSRIVLALRADSVWEEVYVSQSGKAKIFDKGYWRIAGDTLWLNDWSRVTLQNQRLSLSRPQAFGDQLKPEYRWYVIAAYQRAAVPAQPLVVLPTTPATIKTADLLGTWEGIPGADPDLRDSVPGEEKIWVRNPYARNVKHTLRLRPDSIYEETKVDSVGGANIRKGYWRVSGDTIWWGNPDPNWGHKITLQDQRLTVDRTPSGAIPDAAYRRAETPKQP